MAKLWGKPYVPSAANDTDDDDYNAEDPVGDDKNEALANMAERLRLWMTGKQQIPPTPQGKYHTRRRSGQQGGTTMATRASKYAAQVLRDAVLRCRYSCSSGGSGRGVLLRSAVGRCPKRGGV